MSYIKRILSLSDSLLGSYVSFGEVLHVQLNSNIQLVNYLDLDGDLIVDGILGVQ